VARGVALFFGVFSLANALGSAISRRHEDVWWIDLSFLPGPLSWIGGLIAAVVFVEFAIRPRMEFSRKQLTAGVSAALAAVALGNGIGFYRAVAAGTIDPAVPVPFSFVLAVLFAGIAVVAWFGELDEARPREFLWVAVIALLVVIAFPLAQVCFFGTTDYRRPADVAVVLGARVHDDGTLSSSLMDRVSTGVELHRDGLVSRLIMSGGTGANGVDEALAMRDAAVRLGVPESAIEVDGRGVDTDSTVRNTHAMIGAEESVLVVSQFYHLPRIKLAYRTVGRDVRTVPALEARPIPKTPVFVAREIGGFWVYWLRALARDLRG
jgi:vancomycin permeability regulator SanA